MTEERMFRLIFNSKIEYRVPGVLEYDDTEPAPPKDWRPACYGAGINDKNSGCIEFYRDSLGKPLPRCNNCPYRKME